MWILETVALVMSFIFFFYAFVVTNAIILLMPHLSKGVEVFKRMAVLVILATIYWAAGLVLVAVWHDSGDTKQPVCVDCKTN